MNVDRGNSGQHGRSPCFAGAIEYAAGARQARQAAGVCLDGLDVGGASSPGRLGGRVPKTRTRTSRPATVQATGRPPSKLVRIAQVVVGAMVAALLIVTAAVALLPAMGAILPLALVVAPFGLIFFRAPTRAPRARRVVRRSRLKSDVSPMALKSVIGPASTAGAQPQPGTRSPRAARRPLRVSVARVPVKPGLTMPGVRVSDHGRVFVSESLTVETC